METLSKHSKKLDATKVQLIRLRLKQGVTQGALAREFMTSITHIGRIARYEVWQEVPDLAADPATLAAQEARLLKLQTQVHAIEELGGGLAEGGNPFEDLPVAMLPNVDMPVSDEVKAKIDFYKGEK